MDTKTAIANLELLAKMLPEDGWGDHYVEAVNLGVAALKEKAHAAVPS